MATADVNIELPEIGEVESSGLNSSSEEKSRTFTQEKENKFIRCLLFPLAIFSAFYKRFHKEFLYSFYVVLIIGYFVYFIFACVYDVKAAIPLIVLTSIVLGIIAYEWFAKRLLFDAVKSGSKCCNKNIMKKIKMVSLIMLLLAIVGFAIWLVYDVTQRNPKQLISLLGFFVILIICFCGSKYPQHINWTQVLWAVVFQFALGLLVLRTRVGYSVFNFVGEEVAAFMSYSDAGAAFVFGEKTYILHLFAFKVLPIIVFFSSVMNMLYYLGWMQWFIGKLSFFVQITLGTSAIESTVAVANIFVGMTEAPLVVRPYLPDLTRAEIHTVLTAGLGSIAFSVFGVFVTFGISQVHLLTACVMSAPASLMVSRMLYPEREKSKFYDSSALALTSGSNRNIVEAAAAGASMSIKLVANIAVNLIAFLALLAFINATLSWFGNFVGISNLSFEMICSYVFMPLAFLLGADWEDCFLVGQLFGIKTFLNEFVAYESMKPYIERRHEGLEKYNAEGKLMYMSERSEVIAIHALCGFCNISALGIVIGGLSVLMPNKRSDIANMAVRALIGGMLTCCMTASIAGFLFMEASSNIPVINIGDTITQNALGSNFSSTISPLNSTA